MIQPLDPRIDLLALPRRDSRRYPCLLESVARGGPRSRFDILFASCGQRLTLRHPGGLEYDGIADSGHHDFLSALDDWWRGLRYDRVVTTGLPFHGGWFLYLGYELAAEIEPRLQLMAPAAPIAQAVRCPAALIREHQTGKLWLVAEPDQQALADAIHEDLERITDLARHPAPELAVSLFEDPPGQFLDGVARIQHYIVEGDVFQVNLSRAWRGRLAAGTETASIYDRLRITNPAPFAALARIDELSVISSSPERLISSRAGIVETRPIAGTRPRGIDPASDRSLSDVLLAHPKERAEHIMLIDLERNDLGRVCEPGTVTVSELMTLESYAHVHHIVSNIRGRLRPAVTPGETIRAVFPGGTITGCPKVRCMEIISEIERCARQAYTGSLGYLDRNGDLDLNILIRTLERSGDDLLLRAGAGIVADSIAERELDETRSKARGMTRVFDTAAVESPGYNG